MTFQQKVLASTTGAIMLPEKFASIEDAQLFTKGLPKMVYGTIILESVAVTKNWEIDSVPILYDGSFRIIQKVDVSKP